MTNSVNTRELVLDLLMDICGKQSFGHISVGNMLKKHQYLEKVERSFITRVTEGTIENLILIDYIINQYSKVKTTKMKPLILNILRMSVYQFMFMDSVPNAAVVNESVKLATKRGFYGLKGFVNGVLRNIERNLDNIDYPNASENLVEHMSIVYSMPKWIVEQWFVQYGVEEGARMIKAVKNDDDKSVITIRVNTAKTNTDSLKEMLTEEGITVRDTPYLKEALYITDIDYISKLNSFKEGYFSVQDISSMMVAHIASPKKDDYCIDMCAAPGGKSIHLCELMKGTGMVEARDVSERKINLIKDNIERVDVKNIIPMVRDALVEDEDAFDKADIVIADLPCSGLGVIGKKSDIKYNMTEEKQNVLVNLQRDILKNAVKYVKVGGTLIFSTCTTNKKENIDNYRWLKDNFEFDAVDFYKLLPDKLKRETAKEGYIQLIPGVDSTDGFFISKFVRKK